MKKAVLAGLGTSVLAAAASADITGAYVVSYSVTAADFDGSDVSVNVQDLYLASDDNAETFSRQVPLASTIIMYSVYGLHS